MKNSYPVIGYVEIAGNLFDDVEPNGESKTIKLHVDYNNDADHFEIETIHGNIRVISIHFQGELKIIEEKIPLMKTTEYKNIDEHTPISQVAIFSPQFIQGHKLSLEFHKLTETGETHVLLRKIK